ncbi:MAG TPA: LysR family transcriptional regulator [Polyangiaceae bacterium]|nr:LysR family transcriptional regulator [Polyangiaceae bacterium]
MDLRDLEYFLAVVEAKSVTLAARRVHAAQPTLSHALSRLEEELGERLLERKAKTPLRLTDAGELVVARARQALSAVTAMRDDLSALRGQVAGQLRIAAIQSLSATLLPGVLSRLAREYPGIKPSVRTLAAESIARAVASGRADVGLLAGAPRSSLRGLSVKLLFEEPLVALLRRTDALARAKRLRLSQLAQRELLLVPDGTFLSDIVHEACERAGFVPRVRLTLASAEALRETVRAGLGLTILPRGYASPADRDLVAVPLSHPTPKREVLLVERGAAGLLTPRAAQVFAELVAGAARA